MPSSPDKRAAASLSCLGRGGNEAPEPGTGGELGSSIFFVGNFRLRNKVISSLVVLLYRRRGEQLPDHSTPRLQRVHRKEHPALVVLPAGGYRWRGPEPAWLCTQ